jgi:probable rRNA maturation factor
MAIKFFFSNTKIALPERTRLKQFIKALFKKNGKSLDSLSYIFCTDEFLLEINQKFLKHDYYTDIITFNLSGSTDRVEGEAYISIDRVKDNAKQLGTPANNELHRVIFHGALHLCGYKDKTSKDKTAMTKAEDNCLRRYIS